MKGYTHIDAEPFPVHTLKRVERPTTVILDDKVERVRERDAGFIKAATGDYGPVLEREFRRFIRKQPLGNALSTIRTNMIPFQNGPVAPDKAPLPRDPEALTRHIKETAYFLRADQVGVCELPPYAVYSNNRDVQPGCR